MYLVPLCFMVVLALDELSHLPGTPSIMVVLALDELSHVPGTPSFIVVLALDELCHVPDTPSIMIVWLWMNSPMYLAPLPL